MNGLCFSVFEVPIEPWMITVNYAMFICLLALIIIPITYHRLCRRELNKSCREEMSEEEKKGLVEALKIYRDTEASLCEGDGSCKKRYLLNHGLHNYFRKDFPYSFYNFPKPSFTSIDDYYFSGTWLIHRVFPHGSTNRKEEFGIKDVHTCYKCGRTIASYYHKKDLLKRAKQFLGDGF